MKISKSRRKKCDKGLHVYCSKKYERVFGSNATVLVKRQECIYCGKKLLV